MLTPLRLCAETNEVITIKTLKNAPNTLILSSFVWSGEIEAEKTQKNATAAFKMRENCILKAEHKAAVMNNMSKSTFIFFVLFRKNIGRKSR
jgi:hypothetical protein